MGTWKLERLTSRANELRKPDRLGTNFRVTFHLVYTPSTVGRFQETPTLDWSEEITALEHHDGTYWSFSTNMYKHNPTSQTLLAWPKRYVAAYDAAAGHNSLRYGSSTLFDKHNKKVTAQTLGTGKATGKDKADAVRSYLGRHGGRLVIEIHDTPAILFRAGQHKERLLRFNCGLVGHPLRARGEQHLDIDCTNGLPPARATVRFSQTSQGAMRMPNLRMTPPPAMVSQPRNGVLASGEYA